MVKIGAILAIILVIFMVIQPDSKEIPDEAIRIRIIAHSDTPADQALKRTVRDAVVRDMNTYMGQAKSIEQARALIVQHQANIEQTVARTLQQHHSAYGYHVRFGSVPFPEKTFHNEVYAAGNYEALLITLGEGEGHNWWCVVFPNMNEQPQTSKEVKFLSWEMIKKVIAFFTNLFT